MGAFEYAITDDGDNSMNEFFASMPHLSLCLRVLWSSMDQPGCLPLDSFNYYSELHVNFEASASPMQSVHVWLQATPQGGKLMGSDAFVALDFRVPDGGWLLSQHREHSGFQIDQCPCRGRTLSQSPSQTPQVERMYYPFHYNRHGIFSATYLRCITARV